MQEADGTTAFDADLALLRETAQEAGAIALRYFQRSPEVWMKGGNSPVSEADYAVDRFLRERLLAARPGYGWLSEETADSPDRLGAPRTFVVDPIDGTRGFLEGRSDWCVCLSVVEQGRTVAGVLECPAKRETYAAAAGGGASCNSSAIRVRAPGPIFEIAGPKPLIDRLADPPPATLRRVSYIPSLAYRLAMIAAGTLDATFVKPSSHDWDLAAADVILREAGGSILTAEGKAPLYAGAIVRHGLLVAGSGPLLDRLASAAAAADV